MAGRNARTPVELGENGVLKLTVVGHTVLQMQRLRTTSDRSGIGSIVKGAICAVADVRVRRRNNPLAEQRQPRAIRKTTRSAILRIIPDTVGPIRWKITRSYCELVKMNCETLGDLNAVIGLSGGRAAVGLAMLISVLTIQMTCTHGLAVL